MCTSLINVPPEKVYTIKRAEERGLCSSRLEDVGLVGDSFKEFFVEDFKVPQLKNVSFIEHIMNRENFLTRFINHYLGPRPVFIHEMCIGCRDCEKCCPADAIVMKDKRPVVDLNECIRCYCCQELCPKKAVEIKRNLFFKKLK